MISCSITYQPFRTAFPPPSLAQTQQIPARKAYFADINAQHIEALPYGVADDAEVALQYDGPLLCRIDAELAEVEDESFQIPLQPVAGWLHAVDVGVGPILGRALAAFVGCFSLVGCFSFECCFSFVGYFSFEYRFSFRIRFSFRRSKILLLPPLSPLTSGQRLECPRRGNY